jgi:hypothetical protein
MKAKKTKNVMYLAVALILLFSISTVGAEQYTMKNYPSGWEGGPFIIDPEGAGATFNSFCLEYSEHFSYNNTYWGTIEDYAFFGGRYIDVWGGTASSSTTSDPLSERTKKLYDYALDNWSVLALDINKLRAIQSAIWASEAEINPADLSGDALTYYTNAPNWTLDRNIRVLNLWSRDVSAPYADDWDYKVQSQLIEVPVPEPTSLLLLGLGLVGLGISLRRFKG